MDEETVNIESYSGRQHDQKSISRLSDLNQGEIEILEPIINAILPSKLAEKVTLFDLSDETLRAIQNDLLQRLSRLDSESSGIQTKIKKIDRILKLRKVEITDD